MPSSLSWVSARIPFFTLFALLSLPGCDADGDKDAWGEFESDGPKVAEVLLESPPTEFSEPELLKPPRPTLFRVIKRIGLIEKDPEVKGMLLRVGGFGGAWARAADLRGALTSFREAKKPIHCHFETTDNNGFALMASVCDRISMTPAGWLNLVGVAAQVFYARTLLDRLGLQADFLRMGKYKSAIEPFTEDSMSEATRESLGALLDDFQQELLSHIAKGRKLTPEKVQEAMDEGPLDAVRALELGLIDDVGFDDEAREHLRKATKEDRVRRLPLGDDSEDLNLAAILEALSGKGSHAKPRGKRIALVYVIGTITDGEEQVQGSSVSGPFVRKMRQLGNDDEIKAVVLRIASPGGSALASDRMWHAVRRVAKRKPVVVSVGDMAASGGYYIASAGKEIYADQLSIVGSIGVFGGKVSMAGLADKTGVNFETLRRGQNATWASATSTFSDSERAALERMLRRTYWRFIHRVADGREMDRKPVRDAAEGRVMSAKEGLERGLVDKIAGLQAAIARARDLGKVDDDAPVEQWPPEETFLDMIARGSADEAIEDAAMAPFLAEGTRLGVPLREAAFFKDTLLSPEPILAADPYFFRIE
ncbi:MAG: signal peptide peptidase SppA [Myxococcales bacterium]|nr:signal peptide peptidase SppA [Myxococcales bacterium]